MDVTSVFTDIEGSTRLWEQQPQAMRAALAAHDALARDIVAAFRGRVVKTTGDGLHAAFEDTADAVSAMVALAQALADPRRTAGLALPVRQGAHCGADEGRDGDYFGRDVNRAARLMGAAHGGQLLVSQAVVDRLQGRWPEGIGHRDLGLVRLRDLSEAQRVHQLLHAELRAGFPALRSLEATPNNLPAQLNRFIGRAREAAAVRSLLEGHRLVTVLGLGGLGKSRLSVQLAAELLDEFPDGVWFAELAAVTDGSLVPHTVAGLLGVQEEPGRSLVESMQHVLRDRRALLVVDNCEHVLAACADMVKRLLQGTKALRILTTSREALRVAGEASYALPALSAPPLPGRVPLAPGQAAPTPQSLMALDAVRLFVDRAGAARSGFELTAANAPAVALICAHLDGIPLALELAAARVRSLSVHALAERLTQRFRLLHTTDQTVMPRQRTLSALIDWSHELLDPAEQRLFARLSVFAGGFTLEAAEAVGSGGSEDPVLPPGDVLERLASLVEKSLVSLAGDAGRYGLLDTVRAYAFEKLVADPADAQATADRHLDFFLGIAKAGFQGTTKTDGAHWMARLDLERENLLAAQRHAVDRPGDDARPALWLAYLLGMFWTSKGQLGLLRQLSHQALTRPGAERATADRIVGLLALGQAAYFSGEPANARGPLIEAVTIARSIGSAHWLMRALTVLAYVERALGQVGDAEPCFAEALELAQSAQDHQLCASVVSGLLLLKRSNGALDSAWELAQRSLDYARSSGREDAVAVALINACMVRLDQGDLAEVVGLLAQALQLADQLDSVTLRQYGLDAAVAAATLAGDCELGARWYGHVERLAQDTGLQRDPVDQAFIDRRLVEISKMLGEAALAQAKGQGAQGSTPMVVEEALRWLRGHPDAAAKGSAPAGPRGSC